MPTLPVMIASPFRSSRRILSCALREKTHTFRK
jgi:hypothetical protein